MRSKKLGSKQNASIDSFVPGRGKVRNSLSLIHKKKTEAKTSDVMKRGAPASRGDLPSTIESFNIAQTSMESMCRIDDNGLDSRDEFSHSSIEQTRETPMVSPRIFDVENSPRALSQDFTQPLPPIKRKVRSHGFGTLDAGSDLIKNSTMNQSAVEACSLTLGSVSPIADGSNRAKAGQSYSWSEPTGSGSVQDHSSVRTEYGKVPDHVKRFMRKFDNVEQEQLHRVKMNEGPSAEDWSPTDRGNGALLCDWLSPMLVSKRKMRTYTGEKRRSHWEEVVSSIHEQSADSDIPLGREPVMKSTVNSDEITPDDFDCGGQSIDESRRDQHAEIGFTKPEISKDRLVSPDLAKNPDDGAIEPPQPPSPLLDEVGLAAIASPRRIIVHHSTPVRLTDPINSMKLDELGTWRF